MRSKPTTSAAAPVRVFIAYDHPEAASRAELACARLQQASGFDIGIKLWRFDILKHPEAQRDVEQDATGADMVMVAWNDPGKLPQPAMHWLDQWAQNHSGQRAALAALPVGPAHAAGPEVIKSLQHIARRNRLDFLCEKAAGTTQAVSPSDTAASPPSLSASTSAEGDSYAHWGIND